eukprot:5132435-Heterocapsa_arctica.AAC.1
MVSASSASSLIWMTDSPTAAPCGGLPDASVACASRLPCPPGDRASRFSRGRSPLPCTGILSTSFCASG